MVQHSLRGRPLAGVAAVAVVKAATQAGRRATHALHMPCLAALISFTLAHLHASGFRQPGAGDGYNQPCWVAVDTVGAALTPSPRPAS